MALIVAKENESTKLDELLSKIEYRRKINDEYISQQRVTTIL